MTNNNDPELNRLLESEFSSNDWLEISKTRKKLEHLEKQKAKIPLKTLSESQQ